MQKQNSLVSKKLDRITKIAEILSLMEESQKKQRMAKTANEEKILKNSSKIIYE